MSSALCSVWKGPLDLLYGPASSSVGSLWTKEVVWKGLATSWPASSLAIVKQDPVLGAAGDDSGLSSSPSKAHRLLAPRGKAHSQLLWVVTTVLSVLFPGTGHHMGCWVQKSKEIFRPAASLGSNPNSEH